MPGHSSGYKLHVDPGGTQGCGPSSQDLGVWTQGCGSRDMDPEVGTQGCGCRSWDVGVGMRCSCSRGLGSEVRTQFSVPGGWNPGVDIQETGSRGVDLGVRTKCSGPILGMGAKGTGATGQCPGVWTQEWDQGMRNKDVGSTGNGGRNIWQQILAKLQNTWPLFTVYLSSWLGGTSVATDELLSH